MNTLYLAIIVVLVILAAGYMYSKRGKFYPIDINCATSADCPTNMYCSGGACKQTKCTADTDCPTGTKCTNGYCASASSFRRH